jgi:hypothetical protein
MGRARAKGVGPWDGDDRGGTPGEGSRGGYKAKNRFRKKIRKPNR